MTAENSGESGGENSGESAPASAADALDGVPKQLNVAGVPIRVENFTTAAEDPTVGPVSFLSRPREWHAAGVGYIFTAVATLSLALGLDPGAAVSMLTGSGVVLGRAWERFSTSGHFRDALREPAYAAFGSILGMLPTLGFLLTGELQAFGGLL